MQTISNILQFISMGKRVKISIKFILIFVVILLGTIPLLLMQRIVTKTVRDNTLENTSNLTKGILDQSQKYLNTALGRLNSYSIEIGRDGEVNKILEEGYISREIEAILYDIRSRETQNGGLALIDLSPGTLSTLFYPGEKGAIVVDSSIFSNFINSEAVNLLKENRSRVLWLGMPPDNRGELEKSIWCYRIIHSLNKSYILGVSIASELLTGLLGDIEDSTQSEVRLITTENTIFPEDPLFFNYSFAAKSLSRSNKGRFINFTGSRREKSLTQELLIHIYSDPVYLYNMVVITPEESLLKVYNSVSRTTLWTLALLTLFSLGFGIAGIIFFQKRIREFMSTLDSISKGEYKIEMPKGFIVISEDIALTKSITKMASEVENSRKILNQRFLRRTEELEKTRESLIHSEKMATIGKGATKLSHEVNNSLGISITAISHLSGLIDDIADKIESNTLYKSSFLEFATDSREVTDIIQNNLCRASELILGFKSFATDQSTDLIKEIELKSYIDEIIKSYSYKLKGKSYKITLNSPGAIHLKTYPAIIYQIITNLINNSLLHGFENRDQGKVDILLMESIESVKIVYKDDGKGISKDNIAKLYEPFFTTKPSEGGTGLGLNIVRDLIVNKLKGNIECSSIIDKGTNFTITLPKGFNNE